jgi:hypothetical protein
MLIFNRWGEVIFELYDASAGWDGTYSLDGELYVKTAYMFGKLNLKKPNQINGMTLPVISPY